MKVLGEVEYHKANRVRLGKVGKQQMANGVHGSEAGAT